MQCAEKWLLTQELTVSQLSVCMEREEDEVLAWWEVVATGRKAPGGGGLQGQACCWWMCLVNSSARSTCRAPVHNHVLLLNSCMSIMVRKAGGLGSLVHSGHGDLPALVLDQNLHIYSGTFLKLKHKILLLSNGTFSATGEGTSLYVLGALM